MRNNSLVLELNIKIRKILYNRYAILTQIICVIKLYNTHEREFSW